MKNVYKASFLFLFTALILLLSLGCAQRKPYTANFGSALASNWAIPDDAGSQNKFCWTLNLHPKDQIQNVDMTLLKSKFQKTGIPFTYNPASTELCVTLNLDEMPLDYSRKNELIFKISYLAFYNLYEMTPEKRKDELHSMAMAERRLSIVER